MEKQKTGLKIENKFMEVTNCPMAGTQKMNDILKR